LGQERFPLRDAQLSPVLNNIGDIYFALEDYDYAEEFYKEALEIDLSAIPPNIYNQAIRYHNTGMVYKERGNYREALKNFDTSLRLKKSKLPPKHPSIAISHRFTGDVCRAQGSLPKVLKHCQRKNKKMLQK
jgi:tetratricopeptide (TPR) repeat protein